MNEEISKYQHWKLQEDDDHILWLGFDRKDATVNTIDEAVLAELGEILDNAQKQNNKGLILYSAKQKGFIAGADIHALSKLDDLEAIKAFVTQGQQRCNQLASLKMPTVAMINGFCLGGGLELALSCKHRVAVDDRDTKIGLPEVKLGIIPAWGGIYRLIQLIGVIKAFELMLSGKIIHAKQAKKMGVIDALVPLRHSQSAARHYLTQQPAARKTSFIEEVINFSKIRPLCAKIIRGRLNKKVNATHYPAPFEILSDWEAVARDRDQLEKRSVQTIESLLTESHTAKNLIRAFMLREKLKKKSEGTHFSPKRIHVVGCGIMGGDIATWCALHGMTVSIQDQEPKFIASALKRAHAFFKRKLKNPRLVQAAMDRLIPDLKGNSIHRAEVIIEAVNESLKIKQSVLKKIEASANENALIATNTSSIPLKEISDALKDPQRLIGIHFFNPVAKMYLVEIINPMRGSNEMINRASTFINQLDRLPIVVKSRPGFLVNRILMPYLMEAIHLIEEGIPASVIDESAVKFGMPMGPVELADRVGLDVCLAVAKNLTLHYSNVMIPSRLQEMVNDGRIGRKKGQGFYIYRNDQKVYTSIKQQQQKANHQVITDRLVLSILNESVACLREKIVQDDDSLDAAMIYGTGFAPFRGGPIRYIKEVGKDKIEQRLTQLATSYGDRFTPDPYLAEL